MKSPRILFLILFTLFFLTCQKEDVERTQIQFEESQTDSNFIDIDDIKEIAESISFSKAKNHTHLKRSHKKKVAEVTPVGSNKKKPSYYIINYEGGGYMVLTSDKRAIPVLAYSNQGYFDTKSKSYPSLLVEWLESQDEYIQVLRKDEYTDEIIIIPDEEWTTEHIEDFINTSSSSQNKRGSGANIKLKIQYGPLLSTSWGQHKGFNNHAPNLGCKEDLNGKAPAGCVATAMAQIMKYHEYPSNYQWSLMPDDKGSNETSKLIKDIGDAVNMKWKCGGSGASMNDVPSAFTTDFKYSSANLGDFSPETTLNELKNGYPVIISGGEKKVKWLFFNVFENGHAWICDGIREYTGSVRARVTRYGYISTPVREYTYRINWGWDGCYDGWFSSGWNVNGYTFDYKNKMIHNIRE